MISVDDWKPADGLTLEPSALAAAKERVRSLALNAGPGAGKTETLAQRADFLLRTGTCRYPKRILAISFKADASSNLRERVQRRCGSELAIRFDSYTFHAFAKRIIDRFRPILTGNDALDVDYKIVDRKVGRSHKEIEFADLLPLAIQILRQSAIARNAIRHTYSDVFLDEFQDCTKDQYEMVKLVFEGTNVRLIAVGDTKQSIMGWAGAKEGVFRAFVVDFGATPLSMYRNFRSKAKLLRLQNEIIRNLDATSVMPDEQISGDEGEISIFHFDDSGKEAEHLADLIERWVNVEGLPPAEIAVLIRNQLDLYADQLMVALQARCIPFRNEHLMQDITVEPAARLIMDYLSCLYGQREPKAWVRLINQLIPFANEELQSSVRKDLDDLVKRHRGEIAIGKLEDDPYSGWKNFVGELLELVGIETLVSLSPSYESPDRLKEVIRVTSARIEEMQILEPDLPKVIERFSDDRAVRILTIHKCKGLEFDTVVLMAVENEVFFGDQDENRCAYFVAVSRAKRRLVLTHVDQRERPVGFDRYWKVRRTAQTEYIDYAVPFAVKA